MSDRRRLTGKIIHLLKRLLWSIGISDMTYKDFPVIDRADED